ncbi:MAG: DUF1934 domain-containing protein [Lachnospiraceae bacterium]|nr:DUF1934 domain-containing protein [Lachnospiraceae bacterium]MBQ4069261.1 DUF1934 domain-containing protein [Lachnospiraceae bacterium]
MQKDIIISINGLHNSDSQEDSVEMIAPGKYYNKNGKHYIMYEEVSEEANEVYKSTIKVNDNVIEVIRNGSTNEHLVFEEGKKNISYYNTPFGNMLIGITTNKIDINDNSDEMNLSIDYSLEVNYEPLSDCNMTINIKSKEGAGITLM